MGINIAKSYERRKRNIFGKTVKLVKKREIRIVIYPVLFCIKLVAPPAVMAPNGESFIFAEHGNGIFFAIVAGALVEKSFIPKR